MPDLIDEFAAQHYVLNNISPQRQRVQTAFLRRIEEWLPCPLNEITPELVRAYMTEQVERGRHVNTVRWYLMMLRSFWRWEWQNGHIDAERWLRLKDVAPPRGASAASKPRPYTRVEIRRLWVELADAYPYAAERTVDRWKRRHQMKRQTPFRRVEKHARRLQLEAIISLALYCGLRRHEIFVLTVDDLHPDNAYIVVQGKRENHLPKPRRVPYPQPAREAVTRWLEFRRHLHVRGHRSPWIMLRGKRFRQPIREDRFNMLLRRLGSGWEFHRLRHTFATERLRSGMRIEALMTFGGWATVQQVLAYAEIVERDIDTVIEQTDEAFMRAVGHKEAA